MFKALCSSVWLVHGDPEKRRQTIYTVTSGRILPDQQGSLDCSAGSCESLRFQQRALALLELCFSNIIKIEGQQNRTERQLIRVSTTCGHGKGPSRGKSENDNTGWIVSGNALLGVMILANCFHQLYLFQKPLNFMKFSVLETPKPSSYELHMIQILICVSGLSYNLRTNFGIYS